MKEQVILLLAIFTISSIYGFIYETIFYYFNDGQWIHRGNGFGPFIQIYAWGGLLIYFMCQNLQTVWAVAIMSGIGCGILEYITGRIFWDLCGHVRLWNYNTEKWNWFNIGGYVCLRSILVFSCSGLLLMKLVVPVLMWMSEYWGMQVYATVILTIGLICICDFVYNSVLCRIFPFQNANVFWEKRGWPVNPMSK